MVPGATLILQSSQELTIGGRFGNAQYQYTLQSADISELNSWAPRLLQKMIRRLVMLAVMLTPAEAEKQRMR